MNWREEPEPLSPIRTRFTTNNMYTHWPCDLCGGSTAKVGVLVSIIDPETGREDGCVCDDCIDAGPEAVAERARVWAERSEAHARWVRSRADYLELAGIELPTPDVYFDVCVGWGSYADGRMTPKEKTDFVGKWGTRLFSSQGEPLVDMPDE